MALTNGIHILPNGPTYKETKMYWWSSDYASTANNIFVWWSPDVEENSTRPVDSDDIRNAELVEINLDIPLVSLL